MKTPSPFLFDLVHSMSSREKAFFKGHADPKAEYVYLFDLISKQQVYNESDLKKTFANLAKSNQFKQLKKFLEEKLIDALLRFHDEGTSSIKLNKQLSSIDILLSKNLHAKALDIITKVEEQAEREEQFLHLRQALQYHFKVHGLSEPSADERIFIHEKARKALLLDTTYSEIQELIAKTIGLTKSSPKDGAKQIRSEAEKLLKRGMQINYPGGPVGSIYLLMSRTFLLLLLRQYKEVKKVVKEVERLLKSLDQSTKERIAFLYMSTLLNLMGISVQLDDLDKAEKLHNELSENFKKISPLDRATNFIILFLKSEMLSLEIQQKRHDFSRYKYSIQSVEHLLQKHQFKSAFFTYKCNMEGTKMAFYDGNYSQCSRYLIKALDMAHELSASEILFARFMQVLVQFELKDFDLSESLAKSTLRFYAKHKLSEPALEFILNLLAKRATRDLDQCLNHALKQISELGIELPDHFYYNSLIDIAAYLKSKEN